MRRLLAVLLPVVLLVPVAGGTASAQDPPPTRAALQLTDADHGRTVHVDPGQQLLVRLADPGSGDVWSGLEVGGPTLHVVRYVTGAALEVDLDVLAPGRYGGDSALRGQQLSAQTDAACFHSSPPCARPARSWQVTVVVDDGPVDTSEVPCTQAGRPTASPAPGTVVATTADDGGRVQVPRDGTLVVQLDGCAEPVWSPPVGGQPLFRTSAAVDRSRGSVSATFRPQSVGTTTVTAGSDARCLHRTDPAGDGTCAVVQRAFSLTVEVTPASSPTPYPCAKPVGQEFFVSPQRVSSGDPVTVQGGRRDYCFQESQEPARNYVLQARAEGETTFQEIYAERTGYVRYGGARPAVTTTYRLLMDGQPLRPERPEDTVVVDRTSGSCATELTLTGPTRVGALSTVSLVGRAPAGQQVSVLFRRYGAPQFQTRRTVVAGRDGAFAVTWTAADDHRWFARTARCDSAAGLTQPAPILTGPAAVRRGDTVALQVRAVPGVRTTIFFRGTGQSFTARRTLTGSGTVRYVARDDQRYYALTRATASTPGLTQIR